MFIKRNIAFYLQNQYFKEKLEFFDGKNSFSAPSAIVDNDTIESLNENFSPTLIQAYTTTWAADSTSQSDSTREQD